MGEVYRSMAIAREYGKRLMEKSKNFEEDALKALISGYPSHGFVIDKEEAMTKFKNVRDCTPEEGALLEELEPFTLTATSGPWVKFISDDVVEEDEANATAANGTVLDRSGTSGTVAETTGTLSSVSQTGTAKAGG
jgi:hypothetical protein